MRLANNLFAPKRECVKTEGGWRVSVTPHPFSGVARTSTVELTDDQYFRMDLWLSGQTLIQQALPDLSPENREILMSGIGPRDWDRMFPPEEDDES